MGAERTAGAREGGRQRSTRASTRRRFDDLAQDIVGLSATVHIPFGVVDSRSWRLAVDLMLGKPVALRRALQLIRATVHGFFLPMLTDLLRSAGRRLHGVLHFLTIPPL
jgi:hypothetical protein